MDAASSRRAGNTFNFLASLINGNINRNYLR